MQTRKAGRRRSAEEDLGEIVEHIRKISWALGQIQDILSFSIIAQYGTDEDKIRILGYLRGQFEALQRK